MEDLRPFMQMNMGKDSKIVPEVISLRNWFAGLAMQALMSNDIERPDDRTANYAFHMADAMIEASKEKVS